MKNTNILLIILLSTFFGSCDQTRRNQNRIDSSTLIEELADSTSLHQISDNYVDDKEISKTDSIIAFNSYEKKGFIISRDFSIYNETGILIKKIKTDKPITEINILEKSDKLHFFSQEDCSRAYYLKVLIDGEIYTTDGHEVYEKLDSERSINFHMDGAAHEMLFVKFLSVGAADDMGLTGCSDYYFPLIKNKTDKSYHLIYNRDEKKDYFHSSPDFFFLISDEGGYESVKSYNSQRKGIILHIHQQWQEAVSDCTVKINMGDDDRFTWEKTSQSEMVFD